MIRFSPIGTSMLPTLREGDVLTARTIRYCEAAIGDILVYYNFENHQTVVHRLVKRIKYQGVDQILTMAEIGKAQGYDLPLRPDNCMIAKIIAVKRGKKVINLETQDKVVKGKILVYLMLKLPFVMAIRVRCYLAIKKPYLIPRMVEDLLRNILTRQIKPAALRFLTAIRI